MMTLSVILLSGLPIKNLYNNNNKTQQKMGENVKEISNGYKVAKYKKDMLPKL